MPSWLGRRSRRKLDFLSCKVRVYNWQPRMEINGKPSPVRKPPRQIQVARGGFAHLATVCAFLQNKGVNRDRLLQNLNRTNAGGGSPLPFPNYPKTPELFGFTLVA